MKRLVKTLFIIAGLLVFISSSVSAENSGDRVPYSVQAILPENQVDSSVSYFDLAVEPGSSQSLEVEVYNSSNEELTIFVDTNFGATNANGVVTYDGSIEEFDESMELPFNEISNVYEEEMTIDPNSSSRAIVDIEIPEEGFDGQIVGGIHFLLEPDQVDETDSAIGFENAFAYVVGVNLTQAEIDEELLDENSPLLEALDNLTVSEITPEIELESVEATLIDHRTGVDAIFANKTPVMISDLDFSAYITERGDDSVLHERVVDGFTVAPNNLFSFPVKYNNAPLEPGEYTYHAQAENDNDSWEFSQDFTISEEQSESLNEAAVEVESAWDWSYFVIAGIVLVIALIIVVIVLIKKLKDKA